MVNDEIDDRGSAGPDTFYDYDPRDRTFGAEFEAYDRGPDVSETAIAGDGFAQETARSTDWARYGKCSAVCGAAAGRPCMARSGRVVDGRTDGVAVELEVPHGSRRVLAGK